MRICIEIGNGGFGPGYGLIGLSSGARDDAGKTGTDIRQEFRENTDDPNWRWPYGPLPICYWDVESCVRGLRKSEFWQCEYSIPMHMKETTGPTPSLNNRLDLKCGLECGRRFVGSDACSRTEMQFRNARLSDLTGEWPDRTARAALLMARATAPATPSTFSNCRVSTFSPARTVAGSGSNKSINPTGSRSVTPRARPIKQLLLDSTRRRPAHDRSSISAPTTTIPDDSVATLRAALGSGRAICRIECRLCDHRDHKVDEIQ